MNLTLNYESEEATAPAARGVASWGKSQALLALGGLSIVFIVGAVWLPPDEPRFVLCPFRFLTGLPCPGCGMTRAFCHLAHGDLFRAMKFNPFSPFVFLAAAAVWLKALATLLGLDSLRRSLARLRFTPRAGKFALLLVLVWWVARLAGGF